MIITALLAMLVIWCLLYSMVPTVILIALCVVPGGVLTLMNHHKQERFLQFDVIALHSRLNKVSSELKFCTVLILMILCIISHSPLVGLFLSGVMLIILVLGDGLNIQEYFSILSLPLSFLFISGLALLFEYGVQPTGVINVPVYHGFFLVSTTAQVKAALVMAKALGAISCLYLLSLTTPMSEIIGVLRRFKTPDIVIELMYLIYRYIFILLEMHRSMKNAAASRNGYINYSTSIHTTGKIYSNLLVRSYYQANKNFDAMESRCYTGEIRFLENNKVIKKSHVITAAGLIIGTLCMTLFYR